MNVSGGRLGEIFAYARNGVFVVSWGHDALAPHVVTERLTLAPASGVLFVVHGVSLWLSRVTAATTVGQARIEVLYTDRASNSGVIARVALRDNNLGAVGFVNVPLGLVLVGPADVKIRTADASTGGTVAYSAALWYSPVME